jgi:UDP-N-acetylmuramyl pentapeptide phosphotransferase/UDP-N-acetylglucosamine-1-phosphate transferase
VAERSRTLARQLGEGLLRVAEQTVLVAGVCLLVAGALSWLFGRGYGRTAALLCALAGAGMMFGGSWRNAPIGVLQRRRQRALAERERLEARDPAARARRELEERRPRPVLSAGGVSILAGVLVVAIGFVTDAVVGRGP